MRFFTQSREGAKICSRRGAESAENARAAARLQFPSGKYEGLLAQRGDTALRSLRLCANQFSFCFARPRLRVNPFQAIR